MTDQQDPTGMRRLLASLRESAPMPDDLSDRIRASVERDQAARHDSARSAGEEGSAFWSEMDSDRPDSTRRRNPAGRWVLGIAAAAVLAVCVGGIVALGSDDSDETAGGSRTTATEGEGGDPGGEGNAGDTPSDPDGSGSSSSASGTPSEVPAFAITHTGTDYSREMLPTKAAELEADPASAPDLEDPAVVEGMSTAAAASDCLARLGQPELQPIVIDVATFDGRDGLLLMAEEAPEGKVRAWAMTTGCELIWDEAFPISEE